MIKKFLKLYIVCTLSFLEIHIYSSYSHNCQYYTDLFGPLQSGFTMGDFVRYTVKPLNVYYDIFKSPEGAADSVSFGANSSNLCNALGYLYAGWTVFNYEDQGSNVQQAMYDVKKNWLTSYRLKTSDNLSLLEFDNNAQCYRSILFPLKGNNSIETPSAWGYYPDAGDKTSSFKTVQPAGNNNYMQATASCGYCGNTDDGNYVLAMNQSGSDAVSKIGTIVCTTGQFFGARIAHLLGVVVNDIPWGNASGGTGVAITPLISGSAQVLPMIAVMHGGLYTITGSGATQTSSAPQGMFQPSTAHFGSLNNFLTNVSGSGYAYNYLKNHLQPAVIRLSQVCSYSISNNTNSLNLIQINPSSGTSSTITSMDQGVIASIQNNTNDQLLVRQVTSGVSTQIGTLNSGLNDFYLHLASLISVSAGSLETASNMIVIEDKQAEVTLKPTIFSDLKIATYIQVLQKGDMEKLVQAFNALQGTSGYTYNQNHTAPTFAEHYLIVTNFDPTISSGALANISKNNIVYDSYRMQIIDIDQFSNKPYFAMLQINKQNIGYGLLTPDNTQGQVAIAKINPGKSGISILYPSITSIKEYTWQSICHLAQKNQGYSKVPLLMIPDFVWNAGISGLQSYYLIWLMSYVSALTECSYNGALFGDRLNLYDKVFGLFANKTQIASLDSIKSGFSSQSYRAIVDSKGNLGLGQILQLDNNLSIVGCGTLDAGDEFNQDIPILNLSSTGTDVNGNPIPIVNHAKAPFVNLSATFGTMIASEVLTDASKTTFNQAYGLPCGNIMMFSLPTQAVIDGVDILMSQPTAGNYQLIITSTKAFPDINKNSVPVGSVLAAPQIFVDLDLYTVANVSFDFLHVSGSTDWNSPQSTVAGSVGKTSKFNLKYSQVNAKNSLKIESIAKPKMNFKKVSAARTVKTPVVQVASQDASKKTGVITPVTKKLKDKKQTMSKKKKSKKEIEAEIAKLEKELNS